MSGGDKGSRGLTTEKRPPKVNADDGSCYLIKNAEAESPGPAQSHVLEQQLICIKED